MPSPPYAHYISMADFIQRCVHMRKTYAQLAVSCLMRLSVEDLKPHLAAPVLCRSQATDGMTAVLAARGEEMLQALVRHNTQGQAWSRHAAATLAAAIDISTRTGLSLLATHGGDTFALQEIVLCVIDEKLGYPDCCWGFAGRGLLQRLFDVNFCCPGVLVIPRHHVPIHQLAVLMVVHPRIGAGSALQCLDADVLRYISVMAFAEPGTLGGI